jgi:pimeloyl-ACP methyl ester carboxylesterase
MAKLVFVSGAFHGGWCWGVVRSLLAAQGHDVFTPSLTGLGDRRHLLNRSVDFETHVADVLTLLDVEELTDIVLCGHSYGGTIISAVADRVPNRIRALVYLDALVIENGERVIDLLPPETASSIMLAAEQHGDGWTIPPAPASAYNIAGEQAAWVDRQSGPHPLAAMLQPVLIGGNLDRIAHKLFIYATGWGERTSITASYARAEALGWRVLQWSCGHEVMIEMPEELAALLNSVARPAGTPHSFWP